MDGEQKSARRNIRKVELIFEITHQCFYPSCISEEKKMGIILKIHLSVSDMRRSSFLHALTLRADTTWRNLKKNDRPYTKPLTARTVRREV